MRLVLALLLALGLVVFGSAAIQAGDIGPDSSISPMMLAGDIGPDS